LKSACDSLLLCGCLYPASFRRLLRPLTLPAGTSMICPGWLWTSGKGSSWLQLPPLFVDSHFTPLVAFPCVAYGGASRPCSHIWVLNHNSVSYTLLQVRSSAKTSRLAHVRRFNIESNCTRAKMATLNRASVLNCAPASSMQLCPRLHAVPPPPRCVSTVNRTAHVRKWPH